MSTPSLVALPRKIGQRPARPRPRAVAFPHAAELAYTAPLVYVAKAAATGVRTKLLPALDKLFAYAQKRLTPRADDTADRLEAVIAALRAEYGVSTREARAIARKMLDMVNVHQAQEWMESVKDVLTVNPMVGQERWLPEAMELATRENVALIQSIPDTMFAQIEKLVSDAIMSGMRPAMLAGLIFERFDVTANRAVLIAQDQTSKWHGSLQRLRQIDAGITEYVWSTSNDERTRPMHRALEGKIIKWSEPPVVASNGRRAHAGIDFRCRCVAVPFLGADWDELSREE